MCELIMGMMEGFFAVCVYEMACARDAERAAKRDSSFGATALSIVGVLIAIMFVKPHVKSQSIIVTLKQALNMMLYVGVPVTIVMFIILLIIVIKH